MIRWVCDQHQEANHTLIIVRKQASNARAREDQKQRSKWSAFRLGTDALADLVTEA